MAALLASTAMNPASNLILVGPTGAGKSCIGRRLAAHFGLPFTDADRAVEARTGASVATIFECEGEPGFRARERAALAEALGAHGVLLATGGGAVLDADNRCLLRERGFVVHLHVSVDQQLQRLARDHTRPLLAGDDRESVLHAMAAARAPLYAEVADLRFDTDQLSAAEAAIRLAAMLDGQWRRSATPPHRRGVGPA